jgi:hypothetical protein
MQPDALSAADKTILVELLRETIAADRFPLSSSARCMRSLAKP